MDQDPISGHAKTTIHYGGVLIQYQETILYARVFVMSGVEWQW